MAQRLRNGSVVDLGTFGLTFPDSVVVDITKSYVEVDRKSGGAFVREVHSWPSIDGMEVSATRIQKDQQFGVGSVIKIARGYPSDPTFRVNNIKDTHIELESVATGEVTIIHAQQDWAYEVVTP